MYDILLLEAESEGIEVITQPLPGSIKGLYCDNVIALNGNIQTTAERTCILAEELGHHHTTHGHILDISRVNNAKLERQACAWAYEKLIKLSNLIEASRQGISSRYELAEFLGVPEWFLVQALSYYKGKYGLSCRIEEYIIYFEPLSIQKRRV